VFLYLSKLLPLFIYPLSLACGLLLAVLLLRRRPRWVLGLGLAALLVIWLGGNRLVAMTLVRSLEWRYLPPVETPGAEVIVLLGGGERHAAAPQALGGVNDAGDRLIYTAWLYQQGAAPHVLASGGIVGVDGPALASGAETMQQLLGIMGVPPEAIWLEPRSRNTFENAVESKKLLDAQGITRIILVTSAIHMPRAQAIFARQGFDVIPAPTDYIVTEAAWEYYFTPALDIQIFNLFPSAEALDDTVQAMKEYIGMAVYRLRGWL
jgi:uncharacterized SAM-binding protein YcdF (DUF218 family)